ncbi:MAG: hypothetical protein JSW73_02950 [Candidatus Woesearchaeota archaeon]|nr:MAG: hypothetical protein JSW73_02950 [Candidatus Woesearchaeota archaeon]
MIEMTIEEMIERAKQLQAEGKKWHFHMLTPDCMFNENKTKNAFVLENETDEESYVNYSDDRHMREGQMLVKMLHGNAILGTDSLSSQENEKLKDILQKAKEYNDKEIHWHHHMLFPNCIYNKHRGKYCIIFEDPNTNKLTELVYDAEPQDDLRKIEVLFYKQKE